MNPVRRLLALVVAASAVTATGSLGSDQTPPTAPKVANTIRLQAWPFPLQAVRLLDGPFRDAMLLDQKYLLDLDPDRLLHNFRVNAGLPSSAKPLGGWEAPDVELRGHTVGHYLSALALMYASTGDPRFKSRGDLMVAALAQVQEALAPRGSHKGYLSAFPESFIDRVEARERVWAPYYTLHKMLAGLLDMYQLTGNRQALDVLRKQVDWVMFRQDRLPREQQQAMLMTEFGGMAEALANLYGVTADPDHLRIARTFDHDFLFDPLSRGEDTLNGLHANTQIPKMIAAAREYELTGETRYRDIATFFWKRVALARSYANGGHSDGESFFPVDQFAQHLGASSSETCNTYNMLKLTRHLFSWSPSAETMDFYERGLYNHILASQDPATGGVIYYCPLKPGAFRTYSTPNDSFWCCVGTGLENHAKYPDTIYFQDDTSLFVNLFIPSELTWKEKGLTVRQETRFPEEDATRLTFTSAKPVQLGLKVRCPGWAQPGMTVTVNGKPEKVIGKPGSYVTVQREWKSGDIVQIRLPLTLRLEPLPGVPNIVALFYGPILLAGDLGKEGLDEARRYGPSAPPLGRLKTPVVPALVAERQNLLAGITPAGAPLTFKTTGIGQPRDVTLVPFSRAFDVRYTVYWDTFTPAAWETRKAELAATEARRKAVENRTLDAVILDNAESEKTHAFHGDATAQPYFEGRRGRETRAGWFSYEVTVVSDRPVTLVCTYRGGEGRRRVFDILVDGQKIATETLAYHPTELLDTEYAIPEALTKGKTRVTVRFEPQQDASTATVMEIRTIASTK